MQWFSFIPADPNWLETVNIEESFCLRVEKVEEWPLLYKLGGCKIYLDVLDVLMQKKISWVWFGL